MYLEYGHEKSETNQMNEMLSLCSTPYLDLQSSCGPGSFSLLELDQAKYTIGTIRHCDKIKGYHN